MNRNFWNIIFYILNKPSSNIEKVVLIEISILKLFNWWLSQVKKLKELIFISYKLIKKWKCKSSFKLKLFLFDNLLSSVHATLLKIAIKLLIKIIFNSSSELNLSNFKDELIFIE